MLETYTALLTETSRTLYRNARDSPLLYLWFGGMVVISLSMLAVLTLFMAHNEVVIKVDDLILSLLFVFMSKSVADMHKYFSTAPALSYPFSTQVSQKKTLFEVVTMVFWVNLGIFVLFSSLFMVFLSLLRVHFGYPVEYVQISLGIILGIILGSSIAVHFFGPHRLRLAPAGLIMAGLYFFRSIPALLLLILCAVLYLVWSLGFAVDSYQFVARKKRRMEQLQAKIHPVRTAIFFKETITLWRDKLLPSFVFTAALMGGFAGYLTVFGENLFIPQRFQEMALSFLPSAYGILGIYIVVVYTAVFPTLSMFLNEEHTLWILRHLPVREKTVIQGKVFALVLPFVASLPFLAYYAAFTGVQYLVFSLWLLVFAFLAGIIISLPIGAKYLGKKSDILVLYCVSLLVFVVVGVGVGLEKVFDGTLFSRTVFYSISLLVELGVLWISISLSSSLLSMKYKQQVNTVALTAVS